MLLRAQGKVKSQRLKVKTVYLLSTRILNYDNLLILHLLLRLEGLRLRLRARLRIK